MGPIPAEQRVWAAPFPHCIFVTSSPGHVLLRPAFRRVSHAVPRRALCLPPAQGTSHLTPHSSHLTPPAQGARVRPVTGGHYSRLQFHVFLAPLPGFLHAIPSQRQPHLLLLASSLLFRSRRRCAAPIHHLFSCFIPSIIVVLSHPVQVCLSVSKFAPLGDSSGTAFAFSSMHCSCCRPS